MLLCVEFIHLLLQVMDASLQCALLLDHIEKLQIPPAMVGFETTVGRSTLLVLQILLVAFLQVVIDRVVVILNDALFMRIRSVVSVYRVMRLS